MPRTSPRSRGIVLVVGMGMAALALTACDPPMPPDVAAAVAERQLTCQAGTVRVSVPEAFPGSMTAVGDALTSACAQQGVDQMTTEVADDPTAPVRIVPAAPSQAELDDFRSSACTSGDVLVVPAFAYPVSLAFNAPGFEGIVLSADAVAGILSGSITTFSDPAIAATNEGYDFSSLPPITVVGSSTPSGAVEAMTSWLSQQAPQAWAAGAEAVLPVTSPAPSEADAVAAALAAPSAVMVLPISVALNNGLAYASLQTQVPGTDGQPARAVNMSPDDSQLLKIGAGGTTVLAETPTSLTVSSGIGGIPAEGSFDVAASKIVLAADQPLAGWPVVGIAHMMVCDDPANPLPKSFAQYVVRLAGQGALETYGLTPLPEPIRLKTFAPLRVVVNPTDLPSDLAGSSSPSMASASSGS